MPDPLALPRWTLEELRDASCVEKRWVELVSMPCCGFTFDAAHCDADGSYTCPVCNPCRCVREGER